jgi:hypothetical protein
VRVYEPQSGTNALRGGEDTEPDQGCGPSAETAELTPLFKPNNIFIER